MILTLGGIGLFLLGMILLTEGIKSLAGTALRDILKVHIRGPISGMLAGTGLTAILQSSSATMLTTIGFVSAGLITFPQALGVIFGANLGTTSTGWIVSMLGFKLSIGAGALPMILIGTLMHLLLRGRGASLGFALAGFGLLFFGIGMMQEGMGGMAAHIDLDNVGRAGLLGVLILVGIGVAMTVVMQSSSAAMAVTLAALHTGSIDITQGAALVIGQNVGTTVTAALAAIGASTAAKRTAAAHILFNILTGCIALLLLPAFDWGVERWENSSGETAGVGILAGFHTAFNIIGVIAILPMVHRFARLIERIVPEHQSQFTRHLDPSVASLGAVGIEVAQRTLIDIFDAQISRAKHVVRQQPSPGQTRTHAAEARAAIPRVTDFIARVGSESSQSAVLTDQIGLVHAIDHIDELAGLLDQLENQRLPSEIRSRIEPIQLRTQSLLKLVDTGLQPGEWTGDASEVEAEADKIADARRLTRIELIDSVARGQISADNGAALIDRVRWLDAASFHVWRAIAHLHDMKAKTQQQV